jgi:hypothetical protein
MDERMKALKAKFDQNLDLKRVLNLTKPAQLMQFVRAQPPKPDVALMSIRELL